MASTLFVQGSNKQNGYFSDFDGSKYLNPTS